MDRSAWANGLLWVVDRDVTSLIPVNAATGVVYPAIAIAPAPAAEPTSNPSVTRSPSTTGGTLPTTTAPGA